MRSYLYILLFSFITIMLASCKSDQQELKHVDKSTLVGSWSIYEAYRGDELTKSLDRAVLEFYENDSLQSNLFSSGDKVYYQLMDDKITIEGHKNEYDFNIGRKGEDTLVLQGKVGIFDMKMNFSRQ